MRRSGPLDDAGGDNALFRVEVGGRLVNQVNIGGLAQAQHNGHTLQLAARQVLHLGGTRRLVRRSRLGSIMQIGCLGHAPPGPAGAPVAVAWSRRSGTAGAQTCRGSCRSAATARRPGRCSSTPAQSKSRGQRDARPTTGRCPGRRRTSNLGAIFCGLYDTFRIGTSPPSSACGRPRRARERYVTRGVYDQGPQ
jgi:hypothetical protein